jgi:hypothetical protein
MMPNLSDIANLITSIAVVLGIAFAIIELRQSSRSRKDIAAFDIVRTVQTQEVRLAIQRVFDLPENADPLLIASDAEMLEAVLAVDGACEMWGAMVFEEVADLHMLDRMVGGWVRHSWIRVHLWVEEERTKTGNVNISEWWQWLYEMLQADPDQGKDEGAHVAYRGQKRD